jgi:hypothetical protein
VDLLALHACDVDDRLDQAEQPLGPSGHHAQSALRLLAPTDQATLRVEPEGEQNAWRDRGPAPPSSRRARGWPPPPAEAARSSRGPWRPAERNPRSGSSTVPRPRGEGPGTA